MLYHSNTPSRRQFLQSVAVGAGVFTTPGVFAEELMRTPHVGEGPFYPDKLPLDTDNDLLIINDTITPAVGEVTHLTGVLKSPSGEPIRNALVEIWQCDGNGVYLHTGGGPRDKQDGNFQGYGRFLTDRKGQYYFRTIKPVPYTGRTPHIHFAVSQRDERLLTTQMFIKGHEQNAGDFLVRRIPQDHRSLVEIDFQPIAGSTTGELAANFDLVVGLTPEDDHADNTRDRRPRQTRRPS